jgi:hypothetical protein
MIADVARALAARQGPARRQPRCATLGTVLEVDPDVGPEPATLLERLAGGRQPVLGVGRVEEHDLEGLRGRPSQVGKGILEFYLAACAAEHRQSGLNGPRRSRIALDKDHLGRPSRERLEAERAAAGKEVETATAGQLELQPVEHRFPDPVRGRPQLFLLREIQFSSTPFPADDPYQATAGGLACRGRIRGGPTRPVCCVCNMFGPVPRAVVARHRQASVGFVKITNTRDATRGFN